MPLLPLPEIPPAALQREFFVDDARLEVTSMDIPPHGAFFVAGCSNGMVLLFDLTESAPQRNGILLAQIRAKGMHTNLRLTVKISDDSRMCFAGVMKGSSEMIAIDLSTYLVDWSKMSALHTASSFKSKKQQQAALAAAAAEIPKEYLNHYIFETFTHSDAKLRGFGAAASLPHVISTETTSSFSEDGDKVDSDSQANEVALVNISTRKYLLACGMGIKNVHIWQLAIVDQPVAPVSSNDGVAPSVKRDEWTCIYDVASNGMTITHLGFRNDGKELLTKSANVNIRVWDLSKYAEEPSSRPSYEDIPNSADVKCLLERTMFTYGGTYEFAMVKVDKNTPKEANRNAFELPERPFQEEDEAALAAGLRRRRTMREVEDIIGTQDGTHVMILCTDGGVMYYRRPASSSADFSADAGVPLSPTVPRDDLVGDFASSPIASKKSAKIQDEESGDEGDDESRDGLHDDLGSLQELTTVQREQDHDQTWTLKRIGRNGHVILLKAAQLMGKDDRSVGCVSVSLLSEILSKESSPLFPEGLVSNWHPNGLFYQTRILESAVVALSLPIATTTNTFSTFHPEEEFAIIEESGDIGKSQEKSKKKKVQSPVKAFSPPRAAPISVTQSGGQSTPQPPGSAVKEPKPTATAVVSTPTVTVAKKPPKVENKAAVSERSVRVPKEKESSSSATSSVSRNHVQALFAEAARGLRPASLASGIAEKDFSFMLIPDNKEWPALKLGTLPRVKRTILPDEPIFVSKKVCLGSNSVQDHLRKEVNDTVKSLIKKWHNTVATFPFPNDISLSAYRQVGAATLQVMGQMMREQMQVRGMFMNEIEQALTKSIDDLVGVAFKYQQEKDALSATKELQQALSFFSAISKRYQQMSNEMIQRQNIELKGLFGREDLGNFVTSFHHYSGFSLEDMEVTSEETMHDQVFYRYEEVYPLTEKLSREIQSVILRSV